MLLNVTKGIEYWIKAGVFLLIFTYLLRLLSNNVADPDLWGYMAFGRLFWESKMFPFQDVFSYTPTLKLWVYHEWLTGVLFYPLYQFFGPQGLQALKYVLALGTLALVYLTARVRGAYPLAAIVFLAIILKLGRFGYSPVRAQVFTFFFFALSLYFLERARLKGMWRNLYLLPLIQLPWANLHGGFVAGLGLIGIYAVGEFLSHRPYVPYLYALVLSGLVTLINPYGINYWSYMAHAVLMPRPEIIEWTSILQVYRAGQANFVLFIYLATLIFMVLLGMWQSRWREVTSSLALALTLILGLRHIRHIIFFVILVGAYIPVCLEVNIDFLQSHPILLKIWNNGKARIGILVTLLLFSFANLYFFISMAPFSLLTPGERSYQNLTLDNAYYPVGAVKFIKEEGLSGNILAKFEYGEYLIWELYPKCLVAIDGRYETVYPPEVAEKYFNFQSGSSNWRQFLEDYPPDFLLLEKTDKIMKLVQRESGWRPIFSDTCFVLFKASRK
jgi:hypothetical protein